MKHVVAPVTGSVLQGLEEGDGVVVIMEELKMASVRSIVGFDEPIFRYCGRFELGQPIFTGAGVSGSVLLRIK